jgi:hypothetical protein
MPSGGVDAYDGPVADKEKCDDALRIEQRPGLMHIAGGPQTSLFDRLNLSRQ